MLQSMSDVCYKPIQKSINYETMIYKIAQFFLITFAYDISTQKNSFQLYGMTSCVREISFLFRMQKFQQQSVFRNILWRWYKYKARVIGHLKQSIHGCWHNHNQSIKQRFSFKNTVSESSMDRLQSSLWSCCCVSCGDCAWSRNALETVNELWPIAI